MAIAVDPRPDAVPRPPRSALPRLARSLGTRLAQLVVVVLILVVGTAIIVRLTPGDPAQAILGQQATPGALAHLRDQLGLDRSVSAQVADQVRGVLHGDLGRSITKGEPVLHLLGAAFPVTVSLMAGALIIGLVVSVPLGLAPGLARSRRIDRAVAVAMVLLLAVPVFVSGLYLLLVVALNLHLAPAGGWGDGWPGNLRYAWLPSLALSGMLVPVLTRAVQRSAREVLDEEFVEAARARGLSERAVLVRHVLPNVLLPLITLVGYNASILLGAAVVVEAVFGIPGFGTVVLTAVGARDYPVLVGATLFSGVFVVAVNLATDVLYAVADPRTRAAA